MKTVTCKKCGWVAVEVSRDFAESEVKSFNKYFESLTKQEQEDYYGNRKASLKRYEHCMLCNGPYTNFRDSNPGDCPDGCTLNSIITRDE